MDKIILAAGKTGGHLFPAAALSRLLRGRGIEVFLVGAALENNPFVEREAFDGVFTVSGSPFRKNIFSAARHISAGLLEARQICKKIEPIGVISFGGYGALPAAAAAFSKAIKLWTVELDLVPSLVHRLFAHYARCHFLHFPTKMAGKTKLVQPFESLKLLPGLSSFEKNHPTLLILGGSQGSLSINRFVEKNVKALSPFHVIHITGALQDRALLERLYHKEGISHEIYPFYPKMGELYQRSDLVISRGGSSVLRELIAMGLPALIIPHPSKATHQKEQARYFANELGGGRCLLDRELENADLGAHLEELWSEREFFKERLFEAKSAMSSRPSLVDLLMEEIQR